MLTSNSTLSSGECAHGVKMAVRCLGQGFAPHRPNVPNLSDNNDARTIKIVTLHKAEHINEEGKDRLAEDRQRWVTDWEKRWSQTTRASAMNANSQAKIYKGELLYFFASVPCRAHAPLALMLSARPSLDGRPLALCLDPAHACPPPNVEISAADESPMVQKRPRAVCGSQAPHSPNSPKVNLGLVGSLAAADSTRPPPSPASFPSFLLSPPPLLCS